MSEKCDVCGGELVVCIDCIGQEQVAFEDRVRANTTSSERERCAQVCEAIAVQLGEPHELTEYGLARHDALIAAAAAIRSGEQGEGKHGN